MIMNPQITCFIPFAGEETTGRIIKSLRDSRELAEIFVVTPEGSQYRTSATDVHVLYSDGMNTTRTLKKMAQFCTGAYVLVYLKPFLLEPGEHSISRMLAVCSETGAGMVYSGYYENRNGELRSHPVIDYQEGSLRDDFDFGSLLLFSTPAFREACSSMNEDYSFAAVYDLRLKISQKHRLIHIPELLYTDIETDFRKSGEKQFDYVDPKNREVQVEMERACTDHLRKTKAYLSAEDFLDVDFREQTFDVEASVIIPVRNRVKTISDAIESVLGQKADFKFNLIIVDNHSTDGTTELIKKFAERDNRIIHIIPDRKNLGIGGCWNKGIFNTYCGKFAVQLDSDDLYIDSGVLSRVVNAFYEQNCAMVIGSYRMVNFKLEEIPPGVIDHREWTPENGRNNALRINGLGAPRAFYTPLLRKIKVPDVSYGEDYALGLAISRHYRIGRLWEPLYLCRRWDENSDSALDITRINSHNHYKDRIRTIELLARQQLIKNRE